MTAAVDRATVMGLDRLVHEPARLLILTVLVNASEVEFAFLEQTSGLSKGNLSSHLSKLEAAGLVTIKKGFRGKRPLTRLKITPAGRKALTYYRRQLAVVMQVLPDSTAGDDRKKTS